MNFLQQYKRDSLALFLLTAVIFLLFVPLLSGKVAMNGNFLVSSFSPWRFETFEGYPAGVPAKPGMPDQLRLYLPYMRFTIDEYRQGRIPLWNPHNFSGNPHMAEWQSAVFYPFNTFMSFWDLLQFWHFMVISGFLFAVWFMYVFLRSKVGIMASVLGSIAWGLSLYMVTHSQEVVIEPHSIVWLPLLLLVVDRLNEKLSWRWWMVGAAGSMMSLLSGYIQTTLYIFLIVGMYAFYRFGLFYHPHHWNRSMAFRLSCVILFGLSAILLAMIQILPGLELYQISSRKIVESQAILEQYLLPWYISITSYIPDFFGHPTTRNQFAYSIGSYYERALSVGFIPLFFAVLWWWNRRVLDKSGTFFLVVGFLALAFSFDLPTSHLPYWLHIPFFGDTIPNRLLFIPAFCVSVLAAFGLEGWLQSKIAWRSIGKTIVFFLMFFVLTTTTATFAWFFDWFRVEFGNGKLWSVIALRNTILPAIFFAGTILVVLLGTVFHRRRILAVILLLAFAIFQNAYGFWKFTPFSERRFFYPSHPMIEFLQKEAGVNRFWGYGDAFVDNNLATMYSLYSPEGYDSLNSSRYAQLLYAMQGGKLIRDISRSDAGMSRAPDGAWSIHDHPRRKRLWSMLGVKYLLDKEGEVTTTIFSEQNRFTTSEFRLVFQEGQWRIAEYLDVYPRAYLAGNAVVETDDQKIIDRIFDPTFSPRDTLVIERPLPASFHLNGEGGDANIKVYEPTRIVVSTHAEGNTLLFLSDSYNKGWKATVDGQSVEVYRANFAFRAVPLSSGEHEVVFRYEPSSFTNGVRGSMFGLGLIGIVSTGWWVSRRRKIS